MIPIVRFTGIGLTYPGPPPVEALRPTDLVIMPGEYATVVGPSGSGKSSFLNIIGLLDRPTVGGYELNGVGTSRLTEKERTSLRASFIGFVFQTFHLLPFRTATENVALAQLYCGVPRAARIGSARAALDRVGLGHRVDALPSALSGGEQQRVAIARALVHKPGLVLCDEPTGNLDSATTQEILTLLDELHSEGHTLIVITHDAAVATRGQRRITISDGALHG